MFRNNDKLNLTLTNAKDIDGKIIPFSLGLPLNENEYNIPQELASIDVFEYHEGFINGGFVAFSIYIGEETTINNLTNENNKSNIKLARNIEIESIDEPVCIQNISGTKIVFATLKEQDIVVENKDQLVMVIDQLSHNFNVINDSVIKIRTLSKKRIS